MSEAVDGSETTGAIAGVDVSGTDTSGVNASELDCDRAASEGAVVSTGSTSGLNWIAGTDGSLLD